MSEGPSSSGPAVATRAPIRISTDTLRCGKTSSFMPTQRDLFVEETSMITMSFGDHIEELRRRLILSLLGLLVGVVAALLPPLNLGRQVVRQMQEPAQRILGAFNARQTRERAADASAADSYTSISTRIRVEDFARAVRR